MLLLQKFIASSQKHKLKSSRRIWDWMKYTLHKLTSLGERKQSENPPFCKLTSKCVRNELLNGQAAILLPKDEASAGKTDHSNLHQPYNWSLVSSDLKIPYARKIPIGFGARSGTLPNWPFTWKYQTVTTCRNVDLIFPGFTLMNFLTYIWTGQSQWPYKNHRRLFYGSNNINLSIKWNSSKAMLSPCFYGRFLLAEAGGYTPPLTSLDQSAVKTI